MTLFLIQWKIYEHNRLSCMTYFASMTKQDDIDESPGVKMLGRWSNVTMGTGACVCQSTSYENVASWLYNWFPMAECSVKPICDDNVAREILLNGSPDYQVDYSSVGDEPLEGETLYMIDYKFQPEKKKTGMNLFANLSEQEDKNDAGSCRPLGRWHDLGMGCGMAIAGASSEKDIYKWANNWTDVCDCTIVPVMTDSQTRRMVRSKPNYTKNVRSIKKKFWW